MIGWRAPVARTAFTSICMPAARQPSGKAHPSRQHCQLMPFGSL